MKIKVKNIYTAVLGLFYIFWFFTPTILSPNLEYISPFQNRSIVLYIIPLLGLFKISLIFLDEKIKIFNKKSGILVSVVRFIETSIMLVFLCKPLLNITNLSSFLSGLTPIFTITSALVIVINILSVVIMLRAINKMSSRYMQYLEFRKSAKKDNFLLRIRTKLLILFIPIISLIIIILSYNLLTNYRVTLLNAIKDGAETQVQQASASYRVNLGDYITLNDYLNRQVELNIRATFKYNDLSIYTNLQDLVYMDDDIELIGKYECEFSTLFPGTRNPESEPLNQGLASEYFKLVNNNNRVASITNNGFIKYISPIVINATVEVEDTTVKKERLLGFSIITFNEDVILKPYKSTRNLVILLTTLFVYISIILVFLVGNIIVNPILFLRMNVKKVSNILASMIEGNTKIVANELVYSDDITSRDEIKLLSTEINEMVTVIRGIIPYISASTLQNSNKGETISVERELTFLFTDIRGFTTLCEGLPPNEVVEVLNRYLNLETEIILRNGGDVDKFVGDELMAFFSGENKEINACKASMEIRHAMMNERDIRNADGLPVINIGIGINSGKVVFGSVGAKDRMDFTSIGDNVNLAARLEGANKEFKTKSLISEYVYAKVKDQFLCREIDYITVKGKFEPVRIYEIIQTIENSNPKLEEIVNTFEAGLAEYRSQNWDKALELFTKNVDLYKDGPSEVFINRINIFKLNPPSPNWDGVFNLLVK